jgi:spermidine synthase
MAALSFLFLLSGFSALVYQIVWLRLLGLVFGVTVYAASAVLTSFMAGLAIGSVAGGRLADRARSPLRAFALLELGIAASALTVPLALDAAGGLYAALHARAPDGLLQLTIARLVCSGLILLVPTTLMGASLPLLARHVTQSGGAAASRIGVLYAANTAGGIAGTVLAGFTLIGSIGVTATARLAAAINIAAGLGAFLLARRTGAAASAAATAPAAGPQPDAMAVSGRLMPIAVVVALAGFAGLALEVVWFRLLTLFLTATTYAFTTMLATVLLGIAAGSAIAAARVGKSADPVKALVRIQIWTGVLVPLSMTALTHTYRIGWRTSGLVQACVVSMLPATLMMGATFPFALSIWLRGAIGVGRHVGALYAVNVCGAVAGALAGGFLLLPGLGSRGSLLFLAALYVASGLFLAASLAAGRALVRTGAVACVLFAAAALSVPDIYTAVIPRRHGGGERPIFRAEGVQTTAAVHHQPSGHRVLYLDGLHQANDTRDMVRVHSEIGQLPMALHPDPARALVIGIGGGVTAGAVAVHRGTETDVVELASSVVAAVPFFSHVNGDLLRRPNVHVRVDDGRSYLRLTDRRYDVVTADLIQPIHAGAGNLYALEYFRLARGVLRDGGLMMQWIGQREEAHYKLIMRTFLQAFPHATLWSNGSLMIGSRQPLRISRAAFERRLANPDVRFAFALVGLERFESLLERYTAGPDDMRRFVGEGPVLTDDRPLLEYHRSLAGTGPLDLSTLRGDVMRHVEQGAGVRH